MERNMSQAAILQNRALGHCNGNRPWLGSFEKEQCGEPNRLLIRNASNAYFPQLLSVISLPDRDERIKQAVDSIWDTLEAVENLEQLRYERRKAKVRSALEVGLLIRSEPLALKLIRHFDALVNDGLFMPACR